MEYVEPIRDGKQIDAIKRVLNDNPRDLMLFVLGINSGLRISDLLKLRISDVVDGKGKPLDNIVLREQKTGKHKRFPLNKSAGKTVTTYLASLDKWSCDDYLFRSRQGGNSAITRQQAWAILNDAARTVGITDNIGTHTLRKTFGYHAYRSGVDIGRLQTIFNHSAPSVTRRYIGITQDEIDEVYINLNL